MIKASVSHMSGDIDNLQDYMKSIPGSIKELEAAMKALAACWDGPAWLAFQSQLGSDLENMHEIYKELDSYLQMFENAGKKYTECEEKTHLKIQQIRI